MTNPITGEVRTTTDAALPALILRVLPVGVRGLVVAGFLAALMSSLSSVFNSTSTLFTFDFYKRWRPEASEKQLVLVGRLATVVLVIVGLAWIPFMRQLTEGGGIYRYLQSVQAYVSPPIAAAFLLGIFYKKINAKGALSALWVGFILGMSRLVLEYLTQESGLVLNPDGMINTLVTMNFLHYAIFLFVVSVSVMVVVSLVNAKSAPPVEEALVYQYTKTEANQTKSPAIERYLSIIIIAVVLFLWWYFR